VPKEATLKDWADAQGIKYSTFDSLCKTPEAKQFLLQALTEQAKLSKLRGFEFVKNLYLDSSEFSVEKDTITPTFKLRRPHLKSYYEVQIEQMYAALKAAS
jgi:long-chain acyl-CoA synthetase